MFNVNLHSCYLTFIIILLMHCNRIESHNTVNESNIPMYTFLYAYRVVFLLILASREHRMIKKYEYQYGMNKE